MSPRNDVLVASAAYIIIHSTMAKNVKRERRKKRWWITEMYRNRDVSGGTSLLSDLRTQEISGQFNNFVRMSSEDFEFLLTQIAPKIHRMDTSMRKAVTVQDRLAIALRFLAAGDSYTSLQYLIKVSKQLIYHIVPEVCEAPIEVLKEYVNMPSNPGEWLAISQRYEDLWNFPHCVGAMNGKHVVLQAPIKSGSEFVNYKSNFSIVLFALVTADYNFAYANVGCQGRISDGGVFKQCGLSRKIAAGRLRLPEKSILPGRCREVPYVFLGDEAAFALSENLLKPSSGTFQKRSPERVFNYRLSRARRVVENVFGISSVVFRVLRKPMLLEPEKAETVVMTVVHLHNFLRRNNDSRALYTPPGTLDREQDGALIEGSWRQERTELISLLPVRNVPRRSTVCAKEVRDEFKEYFKTTGRLDWQDDYA